MSWAKGLQVAKASVLALLVCLLVVKVAGAQAVGKPSAQITAVNSMNYVMTARDLSGHTFEFTLHNPAMLKEVRIGQAVYVNFATKQVSLDGHTVAGEIIASPAAVSEAPARSLSPGLVPSPAPHSQSAIPVRPGSVVAVEQSRSGPVTLDLPGVGSVVGQPKITVLKKQENLELRHVSANVDGQQVESDIMRLTGAEAIQSAYEQGLLKESARDALLEHAKNLDPGEPPIYIVNKQIAEAWSNTHTPLPKTLATEPSPHGAVQHRQARLVYASYGPDPDPQSLGGTLKHAGGELSKDAKHAEKEASKDAEHAGGQISDAYKEATGQSKKWWKHWQSEATKDFEKVEDCWVDHKLSVRRHVNLGIPTIGHTADLALLNLGQGTVRFDLPISLDMDAEASVFYIPCMAVVSGSVPLPFFIRPRDISVQNGHLSAGASISANVQQIAFSGSKEFFTPPAIKLLPETLITVGPIPVTLEAYLYLRGGITYSGAANVETTFTASTRKAGPFSFTCNGHGCKHDFSNLQATSEISNNPKLRSQLGGRVTLKPYFWAAVQVGVYEGLLMGRAGPEIEVSGDAWVYEGSGCGNAAGASGAVSDKVTALTADVDANIYTSWQAGALGLTDPRTGDYFKGIKGIKDGTETAKKRDPLFHKHLYFGDLANSTALTPLLSQNGSVSLAQPASYKARMRPCYPYEDDIEYQVQWTAVGGKAASGVSPTSTATGQVNRATLSSSPQKDLLISTTGISPGDYTLSITPIRDKHNRNFPAHTAQLAVHVGSQSNSRAQSAAPVPITAAVDRK